MARSFVIVAICSGLAIAACGADDPTTGDDIACTGGKCDDPDDHAVDDLCMRPLLSRDGRHAILVSCGATTDTLHRVDLTTGQRTELGTFRLAGHGTGALTFRLWDVDRLLVDGGSVFGFVTAGPSGYDVHVRDWASGDERSITPVPVPTGYCSPHILALSPDERIALSLRDIDIYRKDRLVVFDAGSSTSVMDTGSGLAGKLQYVLPTADGSGFLATFETEDRSQREVVDLVRPGGIARVTAVITGQFQESFYEAHASAPNGTTFLMRWGTQAATWSMLLVDAVTRQTLRSWPHGSIVQAVGPDTIFSTLPDTSGVKLVVTKREAPTVDMTLATFSSLAGFEVSPDGKDIAVWGTPSTQIVSMTGTHAPITIAAVGRPHFASDSTTIWFDNGNAFQAIDRTSGVALQTVARPSPSTMLTMIAPSGDRVLASELDLDTETTTLWSSNGQTFDELRTVTKLDQLGLTDDRLLFSEDVSPTPGDPTYRAHVIAF